MSRDRTKAVNVAEWVDLCVRALGGLTRCDRSVWWRGPRAPNIYPGAVILGEPECPDAVASTLEGLLARWDSSRFYLWDIGGRVDLGALGLQRAWNRPWFVRQPSPFVRVDRGTIEVSRVTHLEGLEEFERASKTGFESEDDVDRWYASSTLDEERVLYLVGRVGDAVVTSGATYASADLVGIYAISTPPALRRRGYARSLVEHIVETHATSMLGVWPDPTSVRIYTDAGFVVAGEIATWFRP